MTQFNIEKTRGCVSWHTINVEIHTGGGFTLQRIELRMNKERAVSERGRAEPNSKIRYYVLIAMVADGLATQNAMPAMGQVGRRLEQRSREQRSSMMP